MGARFHIAFPIKDIKATQEFYQNILGCSIGRRTSNWMDIDFFGNQLTAQLNPSKVVQHTFYKIDKHPFPDYHFGAVLERSAWHKMVDRLQEKEIEFIIDPYLAFEGEVGEQMIMFVKDPNGYFIEFKSFENPEALFKT